MSGENPVFSFAHGLEEKPYGCSAVSAPSQEVLGKARGRGGLKWSGMGMGEGGRGRQLGAERAVRWGAGLSWGRCLTGVSAPSP